MIYVFCVIVIMAIIAYKLQKPECERGLFTFEQLRNILKETLWD